MIDIVSSQRGGGSKDVWVLSDPDAPSSPLPPLLPLPRSATCATTSCPRSWWRISIWLGRYSVRCEDKARLLRATLAMRTNAGVWAHARAQCVRYGVLQADGDPVEGLYDDAPEFGWPRTSGRLGWCATQSRSRLSAEHWRSISVMQRNFHDAGTTLADPLEALDRLLVSLTALCGFALDDMTQDDGWRMLMLGRRLERMQFLAGSAGRAAGGSGAPLLQGELEWLLDVGGVSITYRTRYVATPQLAPVLQLLIFEPASPRSLAFQWQALRRDAGGPGGVARCRARSWLEDPIAPLTAIGDTGVEDGGEARRAAPAGAVGALTALQRPPARSSDRICHAAFLAWSPSICTSVAT